MIFTNNLDTALLIDDEQYNISWLHEFFHAKNIRTVAADNLDTGLDFLRENRYKFVIIDLNIPFSEPLRSKLVLLGPEFLRYPGLAAAKRARDTGHNTYQVVVYSVHDNEEIRRYTEAVRASYILKGRPRALKSLIEQNIERTPHGWVD